LSRRRPSTSSVPERVSLPSVTITVPVYNEERSIARRIANLLELDYPRELLHILVLSDASVDRTDSIVRELESDIVQLVRLPVRGGKSAAENAAAPFLRGDLIVNVDATTEIHTSSLKALVAVFSDPTVGTASGRIVSAKSTDVDTTRHDGTYLSFEMQLREWESRWFSIVGANGCFYATRRELYDSSFPEALSRDFASALIAIEAGFRAVSVQDATCVVPRSRNLAVEYRRKKRTMQRGIETLWHFRRLLNPLRFPRASFLLIGHKLTRWLLFPFAVLAVIDLIVRVSLWSTVAGAALVALAVGVLMLVRVPSRREDWRGGRMARLLAYVSLSALAAIEAWFGAIRGSKHGIWEPTRR
jgi:cellulose synthase/poly-beta-1,6-N-acetylglucosamine synthase-like glycosyltransferase